MRATVLFAALLICACTRTAEDAAVFERVREAPADLCVQAEASLRSAKATPLVVPGQQWSGRQLLWMLPDGSEVKEGDLVARFAAQESKMELDKALVELQRSAIARAAKSAELSDAQGKLGVDLAQVAGQLAIAQRYAHATAAALALNKILDAVQDETFLNIKQGALQWSRLNAQTRGAAELALVDAQKSTNDVLVADKRKDLAALELRAPHAGLLMLETNWSGEKPRVGQSMWAGNTFANLPDTQNLEAEIALPQAEAQGIREGLAVELAPLGAPEQKTLSTISWVAAAPALRSRESPVKYLSMKAHVPADAVTRYHWLPGQRFVARIVLLRSERALTVPNIALENRGEVSTVSVRVGGRIEPRNVKVGARGPSRSQILEGLSPGDEIVLSTASAAPAPKAPDVISKKSAP
ncbi:MAG TPA: hypothetical protein VF132_03320 [Rudaea sp.]